MTWMTWRQHRGAATVGAAVLLAVVGALVALGVTARSNVRRLGLTTCLRSKTDCGTALDHLQRHYHWLPPAAASLFALPLLAGMFWGAPLVAREIETGTYRLAWTQSVSRLRWITTKLSLILGATAAATLAVSLLAVWAFQPLIPVVGNRFRGGWFDVQGIVPAAYMLFALALGTCIGAVWRRTIPAMATTIVGFAVVRVPVHTLRRHLLSPSMKFVGAQSASAARSLPWPPGMGPGDWILGQSGAGGSTSGRPATGPPATIYHYIPAGQFWTLQAIEAGIFLVLAAALVSVCVTVVVRSRPH